MRGELVAIDLETTGLDPKTDSIIEVGAVRMLDGQILEEFTTFINPHRPIPDQVTFLTGIRYENVETAPTIEMALPQITKFVGGSPIIAHNVSFDMSFLRERYSILSNNQCIDTYDLASILLPNAPRYNLNSLSTQLGISLETAHRALADASASALLYWELWKKSLILPHSIIQEISKLASHIHWETRAIFEAVLREQQIIFSDVDRHDVVFQPPFEKERSIQLDDSSTLTAGQDIVEYFGAEGKLSQTLPGFEYRTQQGEMATALMNAFSASQHLIIEAGTGTGKSLAYLIPAILWSISNRERVVISTNTITLQDQLIKQDIPMLQNTIGLEFSASVMKGRSNYLCLRRLDTVRRRGPTSVAEISTLAKILVWLLDNQSGDRNEISLRGIAEQTLWQRLSAKDEDCTPQQCEIAMNARCPFYKARKRAETSNILIVNHALLIADAMSENQVLPPYDYAIIDEAHQLEEAITLGLQFEADRFMLLRRLADLGATHTGILGETLQMTYNSIPEHSYKKLEAFAQIIREATGAMEIHINALFSAFSNALSETRNHSSDMNISLRIEEQDRTQTSFNHVRSIWNTLDEFFEVIGDSLFRLSRELSKLDTSNSVNFVNLLSNIETASRYLADTRRKLHEFITAPNSNTVYWISANQGMENPVLHTAPLHTGPMMEEVLWNKKKSVILTSATLKVQDSFDFLCERLFAEQVETAEVGSPFNYRESTLIYLPDDIPDPGNRVGYQKSVERGIIQLAAELEGRVMALFTSYSQLRQTAQAITPRLALGNISVFDQSDGSSHESLLQGFKSSDRAVLLGTKSFWQGVDIPGDPLSALIIVRLPFAVPSDPIFSARSETYTDSFQKYALQDAILKFRQGFGRLIRNRTDRGVVTVFDSRITKRSYGSHFLSSLPECEIMHGSLDSLPKIAKDWIDRKE
jgi:DNA polymerase-3 subunit epsilon/ATP-dependent DNA helicase DinG